MLTTKDKLLTHPCIVKNYENHRRKVQSAGPVIDLKPPIPQPHVAVKWKKVQQEKERLNDIERENRRLLQRLGEIMQTYRLKNFWTNPPPRFLNRQPIYSDRPKTISNQIDMRKFYQPKNIHLKTLHRCKACSGEISELESKQNIPEERIPWEPHRKSINDKLKRNIQIPHKCCKFCC